MGICLPGLLVALISLDGLSISFGELLHQEGRKRINRQIGEIDLSGVQRPG